MAGFVCKGVERMLRMSAASGSVASGSVACCVESAARLREGSCAGRVLRVRFVAQYITLDLLIPDAVLTDREWSNGNNNNDQRNLERQYGKITNHQNNWRQIYIVLSVSPIFTLTNGDSKQHS